MKRSAKMGFTLAELVITVGVIGIIAGVTLPVLSSTDSKYKQLGVKLSKFASTTENATLAWVAMNGEFEATVTEEKILTDENGKKYKKQLVHSYDSTLPEFVNETFKFITVYTDKNVVGSDDFCPLSDEDKVGLRELNYPYGVLKDGTSANFRQIWAKLDTKKYPESKYGKTAFAITYNPNIKGLPKDGQTVFIFAVTEKGYVIPPVKDTCLTAISDDNWNVKSKLYTNTNGACNIHSKMG